LHSDYHKPTDDADKINYTGELQVVKYINTVITNLNPHTKLAFTKTREQQMGTSARFSVTMGIMPDYTFSGEGVRVDGVSDGRPAQKAGLKTGDVILMQALGKFKKGDNTRVKVKRGNDEMEFTVVF
jgi:C-terminal processing protease CtpA/Prc